MEGLADRPGPTGGHEVREDLAQGFENEPASGRPWVRKNEPRRVPDFVPEHDQVEVQGPGFVHPLFRLPPEFSLPSLQLPEQRLGGFLGARFKGRDGIEEIRRPRRAINGR